MESSTEQQTRLLDDRHSEISDDSNSLPPRISEKEYQFNDSVRARVWKPSFLLHAGLILGYTVVCAFVILHMKHKYSTGPGLVYSPARDSIEYQAKPFALVKSTNNFTGPYSGIPNPEIDQKWEALVKNLDFRITEDEVEKLGGIKDGVKLPDGGYLANLNIHHELHCLMRLRWNLYPEFYFPDATPEMLIRNREHSEHCIDMLRLGTMCHSDITLLPYQWIREDRRPLLNFGRAHECVNWEAVNDWAGDRAVDVSEPGYLMHPNLGVSFPNGPPAHHYRYNATPSNVWT